MTSFIRPRDPRPARPRAPSCRSGASSMLRLAQTASPMARLVNGLRASVQTEARRVPAAQPDDFAPSRWLVGH